MLSGKEFVARTLAIDDVAADSDAIVNKWITLPAGYKYELSNGTITAGVAVAVQAANIQNITVKTGGGTCIWFWSNNSTGGTTITAAGEDVDLVEILSEMVLDCTAASTTIQVTYLKAASGTALSDVVFQADFVPIL